MFTLHQDERQFLFESQTKFSASLGWPFSWRQTVVQQPKANTVVGLKQPPDFSYRLYRSSNPSQKPQGKGKGELKPKITSESILLPLSEKKRDLPQLVTRFPQIGSYEAKILFVKNGKHKTGVYEDPKPHDYRQYEANLPNLVTSYSRDPLNLKLKSQHLNTVSDPGLEPLKEKQKDSDRRFLTYKPCESKWDPRKLLPKNPWPRKSASFTRHRRRRGAHTAFLDRVEEKLCRLQQGEAGRDVRVHSAREPQPKQHGAEEKAM
ncbi:putative uncharacterized protein C7orf78 homolog [Ciconia boyciana]|uniref:putative uncharacterized protein C7orf78 homolog n=1 Tax=Ciconia boyciana TaxID=52775 RepID=UPI003BA218F0